MTAGEWRGRLGAALAVGVLAVHVLALQALDSPPAPSVPSLAPARAIDLRLLPPRPVDRDARTPLPAAATRAPRLDSRETGTEAARTPASTTPRARASNAAPDAHLDPAADTSAAVGTAAGGTLHHRPARWAPPMGLRYVLTGAVRGRAVTGQAELAWHHDARRYEARLETRVEDLPPRSQRSAGELTPQGLAPERFAERARHEEAVHFERATGRIVFSANRPAATMLPGAQDRLSLLMQLGAWIAARPQAYPAGTRLAVQTATARDALLWPLQIEGQEELQLPAGHLSTLRLSRPPVGAFEPRIEVWLAPALDYAPVRMRLTQHAGDWLDYQWSGTDRH